MNPRRKSPLLAIAPVQKKKQKKPVFSASFIASIIEWAGIIPEIDYIIGIFINDLTDPQTLFDKLVDSSVVGSLSPEANTYIGLGWNYAEGLCKIITGIAQLKDVDNYRRKSNIAKGLINIVNGTSLLAFSSNYNLFSYGLTALAGATPLAGPAFAFAMLCELVNVSIDLYQCHHELDFDNWLDERIEEYSFLDKRINEKESELTKLDENNSSYEAQKAKINLEKKKLEEKKDGMFKNIKHRFRYHYDNAKVNGNKEIKVSLEGKLEKLISSTSLTWNEFTGATQQEDLQINNQIQKELEIKFNKTRVDVIFKALSFVGMTLAAVSAFVTCPPLVVAATVICSVVAAYYLYKNGARLGGKLANLSIFSSAKKQPEELPGPNPGLVPAVAT